MLQQKGKQVRLSEAQKFAAASVLPADYLEIGWIAGAHGIRGGVRAESFSGDFDTLTGCKSVWLGWGDVWYSVQIESTTIRPAFALLKISELNTRSDAELLQGARIAISRAQLPVTAKETYYWIDLVGCVVSNQKGVDLGVVESLIATGAHDVLSIRGAGLKSGSRLIPFVDAYVKRVDIKSKHVVVEWDSAWDED